jgi:CheY-like chemotaxis protein
MSDFVGSSPLRALLVEDSEEDSELIEEALRDAGSPSRAVEWIQPVNCRRL